ncbi:MAG: phage terminase large subunit family protein [Chthoniobacterales bacterium]|nr:phage terminase large subunit family protein [Chthoniobacterales bacterium]
MSAPAPARWRWHLLPSLAAAAFAQKPDEPLPIWAQKNVFLDRRMTTRPGPYDPDEYPGTWEFQEIMRNRVVHEKKLPDGAIILVDRPEDADTSMRVHQLDAMKATQGGLTEAALNAIRYCVKHDPQNVIFAIDNRVQAGELNDIRLQPTLKRLGEQIFTADDDDAGKFLLKLRRMLIYFLGSYSAGAFAQKMCELGFNDELEEHGTPNSVEDLKSRMHSSERRLLVNMSKPKLLIRNSEGKIIGGPIAREHAKGSMHILEVPCPHCTAANGGVPSGHQELQQDNMKFGHCKTLLEEWDFDRILRETFFECVHCKKPIEEREKRWMNDRTRRRWRRTNFRAEPNHISMHFSDFLSYDDSVLWGRMAIEYINSKGNFTARQSYRNHHEGLPFEIHTSKTEVADLLLLRGAYKRKTIPWLPQAIFLTADIGQTYAKWAAYAFRRSHGYGDDCAALDWGTDLHPDDIAQRVLSQNYLCLETGEKYPIGIGVMDAKFRRIEVHKACLRVPRRLFPSAGIRAGMSLRSVSFNRVPNRPRWFGIIVFNDRDAKGELYTDRIGAWVDWLRHRSIEEEKPLTGRLWLPLDVNATDDGKEFLLHHTRENLVELPTGGMEWKRTGDNEWGDTTKIAGVAWRFFTLGDLGGASAGGAIDAEAQAEINEAISVSE